jgi:hypothetical protein
MGVGPHPLVQLASACSKSVSRVRSLTGNCSLSLLLDSRRKHWHERSSSSRPSAANRRPVRFSQAALASSNSFFCRLHASLSKVSHRRETRAL